MQGLEKPIVRVRRRLIWQKFLATLVWALAIGLLIACAILAAQRAGWISGSMSAWLPLAIGSGLAVAASAVVAKVKGPDRADAAIALDRAFGLNERLSTALTLPEVLRETPAGRALIADAIRHVADLDVSTRFKLRWPPRSWVPLVPLLVAGLIVLVPDWSRLALPGQKAGPGTAQASPAEVKAVVKQSTALSKKAADRREQLEKEKFAEAERLLAQIQKAADDMAKAPPAKKDEAMVQLNKLTEAVKDRQKQIGTPEQVTRQLQQLQEMASDGPADEFAKALSKGDFGKAADELKQLRDKVANNKLTEKEKADLKKQVGEMAKELEKLANLDQRRKQLEEAKKNGGMTQQQFEKEMAKVDEQAKKLESVKKMADQIAKASDALQKGDSKKAAEELGMTEKQLEQMARSMKEMKSLDGAMADLMNAKEGMNGEMPGGNEGSDSMENQFGEGFNQLGQGKGQGDPNGGRGRGRGQGEGDRPEAPDDTASYNTRAKTIQQNKGSAMIEGTAPPSKQTRGTSQLDVQGTIEPSGTATSADALTNQKVPRNVEKHIRGYFDQINKRD